MNASCTPKEQELAHMLGAAEDGLYLGDRVADDAAFWLRIARNAMRFMWRPIEEAPRDGTPCLVWVASFQELPSFLTVAAYHPDAGWTLDELRKTHTFLVIDTPNDL